MQSLFVDFIALIFIILALVMLASKLKLAYPIVLVLGGLALSFTGWFSNIKIYPNILFFCFCRRCFTRRPGRCRGRNFGGRGASSPASPFPLSF